MCRRRLCASFDLVAVNSRVVACDISSTPLPDTVVHVAVFCLSLMSTNKLWDFQAEARGIVCPGGYVLVAEVARRIEQQDPAAPA